MNTKDVGDISEMYCIAALLEAGYSVLKPVGDNRKYDIVGEIDGRFERFQCKTGRYVNGVVAFDGRWTRRGVEHSYHGFVDAFLVYCPQLREVYHVPMSAADGKFAITLRVDPPLKNTSKHHHWAKDYKLHPKLK
jgi:hypothetical protein